MIIDTEVESETSNADHLRPIEKLKSLNKRLKLINHAHKEDKEINENIKEENSFVMQKEKDVTLEPDEEKVLNFFLKFDYYIKEEKIKNQEMRELRRERYEFSDDEETLVNKIKEMNKPKIDKNPIYFLNSKEVKILDDRQKKSKKKGVVSLQNITLKPKHDQIFGRTDKYHGKLPESQVELDSILNKKII